MLILKSKKAKSDSLCLDRSTVFYISPFLEEEGSSGKYLLFTLPWNWRSVESPCRLSNLQGWFVPFCLWSTGALVEMSTRLNPKELSSSLPALFLYLSPFGEGSECFLSMFSVFWDNTRIGNFLISFFPYQLLGSLFLFPSQIHMTVRSWGANR